jgi:diguanylate cyclase (GGDEF)-like protein
MLSPVLRRLATALCTDDRKIRIRLQTWWLTAGVYIGGAIVMTALVDIRYVAAWSVFVACGLGLFHFAMRSGWSDTLADPSMSQQQIVFGTVAVMGGYALTGEARSCVLYPLIVIFSFGAFAVPWRRMVELTAFALLALACTMFAMHTLKPGYYSTVVDLSNFLICLLSLPTMSTVAVLLGRLRERLSAQRAELLAALERIQDLATRDDLTGLPNRRHGQQLLEQEAQRNARAEQPFSIALIDLDHFKSINDQHGHAGGDAVLRHFAQEARDCARQIDVLARWGGEEFLLLMPNTGEAAALAAMERLRLQIEQSKTPYAGAQVRVTCSAGVVEHHPSQTVAETLLRADRALYHAKDAGRNRIVLSPRPQPGEQGRGHAGTPLPAAAAQHAAPSDDYSPTIA